MNIHNATSKSPVKYHLMAELFLCLIIVILLIKLISDRPNIKIDTQGFVKNTVLNFSLLPDGTFIVAKSNGEVIDTVPKENPTTKDALKQLHSIAVAVTEDIDKNNYADKEVGLIDRIISPAMANIHNLPGHRYFNYSWTFGNQRGCTRYDITYYPPTYTNVGACI